MPSDACTNPQEPPITAAQIRKRAYDLWERNHQPEGFEIHFWLMAERELRAERALRERQRREVSAHAPSYPNGHDATSD